MPTIGCCLQRTASSQSFCFLILELTDPKSKALEFQHAIEMGRSLKMLRSGDTL
jgi:hypothetical protein